MKTLIALATLLTGSIAHANPAVLTCTNSNEWFRIFMSEQSATIQRKTDGRYRGVSASVERIPGLGLYIVSDDEKYKIYVTRNFSNASVIEQGVPDATDLHCE